MDCTAYVNHMKVLNKVDIVKQPKIKFSANFLRSITAINRLCMVW